MNHLLIKDFITTSRKLKKLIFNISDINNLTGSPTMLQYHALCYIDSNKHVSVGKLGTELSISSGGVAQLIERLINKQLISRNSDINDKRISILLLSKKGKMEIKKIRNIYRIKLQKILKFVDEDDLKTLITIQKKILTNIQQNKIKHE